jgi:two-component system OmpR family sensor kinase
MAMLMTGTVDSTAEGYQQSAGNMHLNPVRKRTVTSEDWEEENYLIQIWDRNGRLLEQESPVAQVVAVPLQNSAGLQRRHIDGESWRIYRADGPHISVQIAQPEAARKKTITETSLMLWLPLSLQIPLLMMLAWSSVRHGLQPLKRLSAAVAQRKPEALSPLDTAEQPAELLPLVNTLNDLLMRLDQALQQQRNFIAHAAHELRTPVAALQLQLDLLQRAQTANDRELSVGELRAGLRRTTRLINQLLSIARAEINLTEVTQPITDLRNISEQALQQHLPLARTRLIDLGVTQLEALNIQSAREDIESVLDNLLSNALRYTPSGGKVDLALYRDNGQAVLEITDSGPGIPSIERTRIFERFYRILQISSAADWPEGSGLGLAIAQAICDRNGATITVSAGENGIGARFSVRWPLASTP